MASMYEKSVVFLKNVNLEADFVCSSVAVRIVPTSNSRPSRHRADLSAG